MKHLKQFESKSENSKIVEIIKDSLTELTDEKKVFFIILDSKIKIVVKLESHYQYLETVGQFNLEGLEKLQQSTMEKINVMNLIEEGLIRSQINYLSISHKLCNGLDNEIARRIHYTRNDYFIMSEIIIQK